MSRQQMYQKSYFKQSKKHGITSFKYTAYPQDMKITIDLIKTECIQRLRKGVCNGHKGISLTTDSPVFCKNYAEINVLRNVPLRQYFGQEIESTDKGWSKRSCYGVGSGVATVGSDPLTNKTRPMSKVMTKMCEDLSSEPSLFTNRKHSCTSELTFNHVTVLYYLSKGSTHHIRLNPHCDAVVSSGNEYSEDNSQKDNTPTVVLSFAASKKIDFHKRYSNGNKFEDHTFADSMELEDGDMFVLHPSDERVVHRNVMNGSKKYRNEEKRSQFKHAVNFASTHATMDTKDPYQVAISVCFRNVQSSAWFDEGTDCVVSAKEDNDKKDLSQHQKKRIKLFDEKRNDIFDQARRNSLTKELGEFFNSIA